MKTLRLIIPVFSLTAALACAPKDLEAPPAPAIDPLPAQTKAATVLVTGTAEYGARIEITRNEIAVDAQFTASGQGGSIANAFTGRFVFVVALVDGPNSLGFAAVDAAGNKSDATKVTLVRALRAADTLDLFLAPPVVSADDGKLTARVQVGIDEEGIVLESLRVRIAIGASYNGAEAATEVVTDSRGRAEATFTGLTRAGSGTVTANTFDDPADPAVGHRATASFTVVSGKPENLSLVLSADGSTADAITVAPDTTITAIVTIADRQDNPALSVPVSLWTDAPGALVIGDTLQGVVAAGTWKVVASVAGALIADVATFTVVPGPADHVEIELSATTVIAGEELTVYASVVDAFGNEGTDEVILSEDTPQDFTTNDSSGGAASASLTVEETGTYAITADTAFSSDNAAFTVVAGPPVTVTVNVGAGTVAAGAPLVLSALAVDAFGNTVPADFTFATDAAGAVVVGNTLVGLNRAGNFRAYAQVIGTSVTGSASYNVTAAAAHHLSLALSANEIVAGGSVTATASVRDQFENIRTTETPLLATDAGSDRAGVLQAFSGMALTAGVRTASLTVRSTARRPVTITATGGGVPALSEILNLLPAAPVEPLGFDIPPGPYQAGEPVGFTYTLTDSFLNPTGTPVIVTVSAPNVVVFNDGVAGGEIAGLIRAGTYTISARAIGTNLSVATENVVIDPNPGQGFNLTLSGSLVAQGSSFLATVVDAFGNPIGPGALTYTFDTTGLSRTGGTFTALRPSTYSIRACMTGSSTLCDTEFVGVQGILDTVPPTVRVVVEFPDPAIKDANSETIVARGGRIGFRVIATDDRGLSQIIWFASFGASGTCRQTSAPYLIAGGTTAVDLGASFAVPGCAAPFDVVSIVAQAQDEAGNLRNSALQQDGAGAPAPLRISSTYAFSMPGFAVTIEAYRNRLDIPRDVIRQGAGGPLVVTNEGNDRAVVIFPDRTMTDLRDSSGNRLDLRDSPVGIDQDSNGNLYIGLDDPANDRVVKISPSLALTDPFSAAPGYTFGILVDDASTGLTGAALPALVCSASLFANQVVCTDLSGAAKFTCTSASGACMNNVHTPSAVAIGPATPVAPGGVLYIANNGAIPSTGGVDGRITVFRITNTARTTLSFDRVISTGLPADSFGDLVVAPGTGNLIFADPNAGQVRRLTTGGTLTSVATGFSVPWGLAWDGNGLLVVDANDEVVFRIFPSATSPGTF